MIIIERLCDVIDNGHAHIRTRLILGIDGNYLVSAVLTTDTVAIKGILRSEKGRPLLRYTTWRLIVNLNLSPLF